MEYLFFFTQEVSSQWTDLGAVLVLVGDSRSERPDILRGDSSCQLLYLGRTAAIFHSSLSSQVHPCLSEHQQPAWGLIISFKHLLSTTFLLADMIEKCEIASKHKENYLQLSCLAQTIQFWPVSVEKKMPSTPVYDKDGQEKCSGTNPREILVRNRLFKPPQIGG